MKLVKATAVVTVSLSLLSPLFANAESAIAWPPAYPSKEVSAEQVKRELIEFKRNPVSADGKYRFEGNEIGWVPVNHALVLKDGKWVHVDNLDHNSPPPSLDMTPAERRQLEQERISG